MRRAAIPIELRRGPFTIGLDVDGESGPELIAPPGSGVSALVGVRVWRGVLDGGDIVRSQGRRLTSVHRTLRDLTARLDLVEGVVLVDQALYRQLTTLTELEDWAKRRAGSIGVPKLRRALAHAEPLSESPMETRLRLLLVLAGLPRPRAQVPILDGGGDIKGGPERVAAEVRGMLRAAA